MQESGQIIFQLHFMQVSKQIIVEKCSSKQEARNLPFLLQFQFQFIFHKYKNSTKSLHEKDIDS